MMPDGENGIRVRFPEFREDEDEVWDFDYLKRFDGDLSCVIRFSSDQLQDGECDRVEVGMLVCARYVRYTDSEEEGSDEEVRFFDAEVIKIDRSAHTILPSGEEFCNCVFEVSWMAGPGKKKRKEHSTDHLGCADICVHNEADVETHPVLKSIRRFLQGRVLGPQAKQHPARVSVKSKKAKFDSLSATLITEQPKGSPTASLQVTSPATQDSDSDCVITGSSPTSRTSFRDYHRDVCSRENSQASLLRPSRADSEADTQEGSCSVSTEASEDVSSTTSFAGTKKRETCNSQNSEQVFSSRPRVKSKRMRGCVTNMVSPPAWFNSASLS
ncbi:hypothetical protein R1flu_010211 [Riccia fluitans]|uniref:SAWADEE domain-containing protein n=1 Tax=Riccia fluitans TaxID=41844 RepID=A0ABD1Z5G4_9MARC